MRRVLAIAALLTALASPARAWNEDAERCYKATTPSSGAGADDAITACSRALDSGDLTTSERVNTLNNRGVVFRSEGRYDRAIWDLDEAIRLKPDYALAYNNRGVTYKEKGERDRAVAEFDEAIRLKPDYAQAFYNRGVVYYDQGEYERAIADYSEAIRLKPDEAFAFNNRGWIFERIGDLVRAERDYVEALRIDPGLAQARDNLDRVSKHLAAGPAPRPSRYLVERVQRRLNGLGFDAGPADGVAGPRTRNAVAAFQRSLGLAAGGAIDWSLYERLELALAEEQQRSEGGRGVPEPTGEPDTAPPVITAAEQLETEAEEASIEGTVADDRGPVRLLLDGREVEVGPGGRFRTAVAVAGSGIHRKTLRAEDAAGNRAERIVTIVRRPPTAPPQPPGDLGSMRAERRVALVIGNGGYKVAPLRNPPEDARDVAAALRRLRFEVIEKRDVGYREMLRAVIEFGRSLQDGGVGLFYYAGHGIQVGGRNYLIPIDATIEREEYVPVETVDADQVLARMDAARNRLNIVVLDACRDNPYARAFRGAPRGLAQALAPSGTFLAYATAPGDVAADGEGENSPYTEAMLATLEVPGLPLEELFKRVRVQVRERTGGRQTPWTSSSIVGDFYFRLPPEPEQPAPPPDPVARADYGGWDEAVWRAIEDSDEPLDFHTFIDLYPDSPLAPFARSRVRALGGG